MLRLMDVPSLPVLMMVALTAALSSSCTAGAPAARSVTTTAPSSPTEAPVSDAQGRCEDALPVPVAASSTATVGEVRDFEVGGPPPLTPDPNRRPARASVPTAKPSDKAAWCTVATTAH
jgi:hypothetical protein